MLSLFSSLRCGGLLVLLAASAGCIPTVSRKAYIVEDAKAGTLDVTLIWTGTAYGFSFEGFNWKVSHDDKYTLTKAMIVDWCPKGQVYRIDRAGTEFPRSLYTITVDEKRRFVYKSLYHLRAPLGIDNESGSGVYEVIRSDEDAGK